MVVDVSGDSGVAWKKRMGLNPDLLITGCALDSSFTLSAPYSFVYKMSAFMNAFIK